MTRIVKTMLVFMTVLPMLAYAGTIAGKVSAIATAQPIESANVVIAGTNLGSATDANGMYRISNVPDGTYTISADVIGFQKVSKRITVAGIITVDFELVIETLQLSALEVMASRATRNTPVAFTNVDKSDIALRLGSQDIPMVLNLTPSVYATMQGGGAGDARVNIRGFNQRNIAVMINGVPVNDMENGWVYWSNWDGVADATSSIQMQRGLSAVNLATPSIGGTMNILTDPAGHEQGGSFKQELGDGTFVKTTMSYHSGLLKEKWAMGATLVRKTGKGVVDRTWTDAWAYYFGASYTPNDVHRFELYALGAPQRHGQMRYKQNIAAFSHEFAEDLDDYDPAALDDIPESGRGQLYNENWNQINPEYDGKQYYYMYGAKVTDRHNPNYLNESENYFHKPQVNLNWFWNLAEDFRLSSVFYFSGGSGGGTGTFGDLVWDSSGPSRIADWNSTIAHNIGNVNRKDFPKPEGESVGYLRNSINRQWTLGLISKLNWDYNEDLKFQFGLDARTAEIEHAREVRDLLGGDYAINGKYDNDDPGNDFYDYLYNEFDETFEDAMVVRGDIINYHNTNTVDWAGFFGQFEYDQDMYSIYGMMGYSLAKYTLVDHFKKAFNHPGYAATADGELFIIADWVSAWQFKGGGLYNLTEEIDVFTNIGVVEKLPILDAVIDDISVTLATDPTNEQFVSFEAGLNYRSNNGQITSKVNFYNTYWNDRTMTRNVSSGAGSSGDSDIIFLTGLDQIHRGLEAEVAYKPMELFRLDAALSIGDWTFTDDAEGTYKEYETGVATDYIYSVKDLKVGDMPQTILALGGTVYPYEGVSAQLVLNFYDRHYADWDPVSREVEDANDDGMISDAELDAADRDASWEAPGYTKLDFHAYYNLPVDLGDYQVQVFLHVFNLLDELYVQDALDNSQYNAYQVNWEIANPHQADAAEVYMGLPRTYNLGFSISR